ncbi:MAG TPA: hypothetical protein VMU38_03930 [Candidatus Binatia bacterium]|nr:hypothetical protein [Candidatus Binatia bacterium]
MKSESRHAACLSTLAAVAILAGCTNGGGQSTFVPQVRHASPQKAESPSGAGGYVYVTNRNAQGASQLQVYAAGQANPAPVRTVTTSLSDVEGAAVDSSGNVYVANGSGGDVLEFGAGGTPLVKTYSQGLAHPTDVAVANGVLYVADRGNASNGYTQQIMEFQVGSSKPALGIGGLGAPSQLNEGIAINPAVTESAMWATSSTLTAVPFAGGCSGSAYTVGQNINPTLWITQTLSNNAQAWGLAFDSSGKMYASDPCNNDVAIYANVGGTWTYTGNVTGSFNAPLFLTIGGQFLAVPSCGNVQTGTSGFVTVIDLTGSQQPVTITNGLTHPIGAAAAASS